MPGPLLELVLDHRASAGAPEIHVSLRRWVDYPPRFEIVDLEPVPAVTAEVVDAEVSSVAAAPPALAGVTAIDRFRRSLPPSRIVDAFCAEAAAGPRTAARVVLRGRWRLPAALTSDLPFVCLHRVAPQRGRRIGGVTLPLVAAAAFEAQTAAPPRWIEELFDDEHVAACVHRGVFRFDQSWLPNAPIRHIVVDARGLEAFQRSTFGARLVVLHDPAGALSEDELTAAVEEAVAHGASAALASRAKLGSPFFPRFYRALLHNRPIDTALAEALDATGHAGGDPQTYVLAALENGELQPFVALALAGVAGQVISSRSGALEASYELDTNALIGSFVLPHIPRPVRELQPLHEPERRAARIAADLSARIDAAAAREKDALEDELRRVANVEFDQEIHTIDHVAALRDPLGEMAERIGGGSDLVERIGAAKPEQILDASTRLTNAWITDAGKELAPAAPLVCARAYQLHVRIDRKVKQAWVAQLFPEEAVARFFAASDRISLDLRLFFDPERVTCDRRADTLSLPRVGPSDERTFALTALAEGSSRVRVCVYHAGVLLQSLAVDFTAVPAGQEAAAGGVGHRVAVDWVASPDLALLDDLPRPRLSIWTNDAAGHVHSIGLYSAAPGAARELAEGDLRSFAPGKLEQFAKLLREQLCTIEGFAADGTGYYAYGEDADLDEDQRCQRIVALAKAGARAFNSLLVLVPGGGADAIRQNAARVKALRTALDEPGVVTVARCNSTATLPWAALYHLPLETESDRPALCSVFREQIEANHDRLEDPVACGQQPTCPLRQKPDDKTVVCPFGFLGLRHQIEQPLQGIDPARLEAARATLAEQATALPRPQGRPLELRMSCYPHLPGADEHGARVAAIRAPGGRELFVRRADDAAEVRVWLHTGADPGAGALHDVYYFYCHGETAPSGFRLHVGPVPGPGYIGPDDVCDATVLDQPWTQRPLVILNACNSLATTPEISDDLLTALQLRMASGVVGTEIPVDSELGQQFGEALLARLLAGRTIGEAFLDLRRALMRRLNPLGLAYTFYSSALLHFHDPDGCAVPACSQRNAGRGR